ncbi:MAG: tripartite tricarboxylate transporter substrate binding protein BugD, partial [Alphaproteobacteria bacterium]|nr:tripartite tricarboxylate transporter substrate binding protein BugD [Alphaproteobacteria bacterium]
MRRLLAALTLLIISIGVAHAQYPDRPITLVVPLGVGGSSDVIARLIAEGMRPHLGQPIVVENIGGAGGTIGLGRVVRAPPDGYTVLIGQTGTNVATGAIYPLKFDLEKDFAPIGLIATQPFMIVGKKETPADNLKDFIAYLKANASKISEGNSGVGSPSHIAGLLFQKAIGATFTMIPFRGAGESSGALVAGHLDVLLDTPALSLPQHRAGNVKAFAVADNHRLATAPDIPTTDEAGLPGFYFTFWHALWAPKGTPKEIIAKLNAALAQALEDPTIKARLADLSNEP